MDARIALIAGRPKIGKKEENLRKMEEFIKKEDADLYVFGELFLSGYRCKDELRDIAEPIDGESVKYLSDLAKEKDSYIIFGMPLKEKNPKGLIRNASVLVHPDGKVDTYRKWFLPTFGPFEEKIFFDEGEEIKPFDTRLGKIGMMVCYDLFFPEVARALTLQGADIIVCISASPSTTRIYFERLLPARSLENTVFLAYTNLVGAQEDLVFWGGCQIYNPLGNLIKKMDYFKEDVLLCDINLEEIERARHVRPVIRDLRADIYLDLYNILRGKGGNKTPEEKSQKI